MEIKKERLIKILIETMAVIKQRSSRNGDSSTVSVEVNAELFAELARIALAAMDSEPVGYFGRFDPDDEDIIDQCSKNVKGSFPLYRHAQPDTSHLSRICSESYQVIGALAEALRIFNDVGVIKALDNLSAQELIHDDVLPFSVPESAQLAPVVLKDHQIRELVNQLRDIAIEYHGTQQLRERIARVLRAAILSGGKP